MVEGMEFQRRSMRCNLKIIVNATIIMIRFNVMEGNLMVALTTAAFGFDVLDLHYWMTHQVFSWAKKHQIIRNIHPCLDLYYKLDDSPDPQADARWDPLDSRCCEAPAQHHPHTLLSFSRHQVAREASRFLQQIIQNVHTML